MWFLQILGMIAGGLLVKYREKVGEQLGEADWMRYVGGVYNFVIILGIFIFFWSLAALTGTTQIFFYPFYLLLGGFFN